VASVEVDGGRIEQGLTNLLTNAVKFTPRKGRVQLTISQSKNHTTFTVTDTGPGISEDQQRMLFDRYYTSAMEHSGKGVGLGLAIARGIVASHAGSLLVESTPGEGSTFLLTVPNRQRADA
jgi:signal transduction histidine kinase